MAIGKNVAKGERAVRAILGAIFVVFGFLLSGFWKPLCVVIGVLLLLTALVGY